MLDWLKDILGEVYTDEIDEKVSKEIGQGFVAKAEFNAKVKKIGENEKTILEQTKELDNLRQTNVDAAAAQKERDDLKKEYEARENALRVEYAAKWALKEAGAKDPDLLLHKLDLKDAKLAEDGTVEGLADQIKHLTEDDATSYHFEVKTGKKMDIAGAEPGNPGNKSAAATKSVDEMGYEELSAYLANNPNATL